MDFYLEYICQPLLPHLSVKKLLMFTSCNKFLHSKSEEYIREKCKILFGSFKPKISWRYTLPLLKYGKRQVPVFVNLCDDNGKVTIEHKYNAIIYARENKPSTKSHISFDNSVEEFSLDYQYYDSCFQILEPNSKLEDSIENYISSNDTEDHEIYDNKRLSFKISQPRNNCERYYFPHLLNNNKYIGLSQIHDKTLFESITSIDIFMKLIPKNIDDN